MIRRDKHHLKAGHTLTVTVVDATANISDPAGVIAAQRITNSAALVLGPYLIDRSFDLQHTGNATVAIAEADVAANIPSADQATMLDAIPIADQNDSETVWNDAGVLKVSSAP